MATKQTRSKFRQAFAEFDEINTFWVEKMDLSRAEKKLRVEMMQDFQQRIEEVPKPEKERKKSYIVFAAIGYVAYKLLYTEFAEKYYKRYLSAIGVSNPQVSDFAAYWIAAHAEMFAGYEHTNPKATARTETNALGSLAQLDAFSQLGYNAKQWVTMQDAKVRQTHKEANGQTVLLEEPFIIGNSFMMFPQDSSLGAGAEEIVNCRCVMKPAHL